MDNTPTGYTPEKPSATAKKLRQALKTAFPDTKFKVHVTHKVNLTVSWSNGPLENEVKEVTDKYNSNGYKGYEYEGTRYCGAKQIFLVRKEETMTTQASPPWANQGIKEQVETPSNQLSEETLKGMEPSAPKVLKEESPPWDKAPLAQNETDPEDKAALEEWNAMTAPRKQPEKTDEPEPQNGGIVPPTNITVNLEHGLQSPVLDLKTVIDKAVNEPQRDLKHEINRYKTALEVVREVGTKDDSLIDNVKLKASLLAAEYFGIV